MNCPLTHLYLPAITSDDYILAIGVIGYQSCEDFPVVNTCVFVVPTVANILYVGTEFFESIN
jgi:hypothetical protein